MSDMPEVIPYDLRLILDRCKPALIRGASIQKRESKKGLRYKLRFIDPGVDGKHPPRNRCITLGEEPIANAVKELIDKWQAEDPVAATKPLSPSEAAALPRRFDVWMEKAVMRYVNETFFAPPTRGERRRTVRGGLY